MSVVDQAVQHDENAGGRAALVDDDGPVRDSGRESSSKNSTRNAKMHCLLQVLYMGGTTCCGRVLAFMLLPSHITMRTRPTHDA